MRKNMLLTAAAGLAALLVQAGHDDAAAQTRTTLDIYVVDVEGGNATLFVAPSGESLLIDTGNVAPAAAVRDAGRIMAAARDAGLTQIDNLIITHWHGDHYGGLAELAKRIPIRHFIDHGPNVQPAPAARRISGEGLPAALRQCQTHRRQTGRQDCGRGPRRAGGDVRRRDHQDAGAGRRRSQSLLRELQARHRATPRTRCRSASTSRSENSAPSIWAT